MTETFESKIVLITGAASGIGLALSEVCLKKGHFVLMVDCAVEQLNKAFEQLSKKYPKKIEPFLCDLRDEAAVSKLAKDSFNQLKKMDWIINNAGIMGPIAPLWELESKAIQKVLDVNVLGMIHMISAFTPSLLKQASPSRIVNIASLYALCSGSQLAAYALSKHAVLALSESLYFDLQAIKAPIQVSVAFPSFTNTALIGKAPDQKNPGLHQSLQRILEHSRPTADLAQELLSGIERGLFYIFPDPEVKEYAQSRLRAALNEENPQRHSIEKLTQGLIQRFHR